MKQLSEIGLEAFAQWAAAELRAAGEVARRKLGVTSRRQLRDIPDLG